MIQRISFPQTVLFILLFAALTSHTSQAAEVPNSDGANTFALQMYKKLSVKQGNLLFSPFGIRSSLGLVYAGARGDTAQQLAKACSFSGPPELAATHLKIHEETHGILGKEHPGSVLKMANALWVKKGFSIHKEFLKIGKQFYDAGAHSLSFDKADAARKTINAWISGHTGGRIQELLGPGSPSPSSKLILTNAVFFRGNWATPFRRETTWTEEFSVTNAQKIKVPFMSGIQSLVYADTDKWQIVSLPYGDRQRTMILFLPKKSVNLSDEERALSAESFARDLKQLEPQSVDIHLPRFKTKFISPLIPLLKEIGITDAFTEGKANFTGLTGKPDLTIGEAIQESEIEVDEVGTVASAATSLDMTTFGGMVESKPETPVLFRADHPFLYFIYDYFSHTIVFMGRMENPADAG